MTDQVERFEVETDGDITMSTPKPTISLDFSDRDLSDIAKAGPPDALFTIQADAPRDIQFFAGADEVGRFDFDEESGTWEFSGDLAASLKACVAGFGNIHIEKLIVPGEEAGGA